jgi:hypothetical protein
MLSDALTDARAFRALLEDLHGRLEHTPVTGSHANAVRMVNAAILRSAIGAVMAVLDPEDSPRGNRASVGQILQLLKDSDVLAMLTKGRPSADVPTLEVNRARYTALLKSDRFARGRRLRNDKIAHVLISDTPTPTVEYQDTYALHDEAERLVSDLHQLCGRAPAKSIAQREIVEQRAKTFWDTYFAGLKGTA